MKRYFRIVFVLAILFLVFNFLISIFSKGKVVSYNIEGNQINETYVHSNESSNSYYYIEIKSNNKVYNFKVSDLYNSHSYIVDKVYSFNDEDYSCILPIFIDGSVQTDILCYKNNIIYPYRILKNKSLALDNFAKGLKEYVYKSDYENSESIIKYGIEMFNSNMFSEHTIIIPSYNGIFMIDKKGVSSLKLFDKDVYKQFIQGLVSNYYIVADYDSLYSFNKFILVDINSKAISYINTNNSINMDSYVQGVVSDSMYIIDCNNKKQYQINSSNKSISLVGSQKKGILYYNGNDFENRSMYDALENNLLFDLGYKSNKYDYVYSINGIYYSYLKTNEGYDVYISYENNPSLYTYGFSLSSIDRIYYIDQYVYYVDKDVLYCYFPKSGVVKVLVYDELFYNSNLNFWVYQK